LSLELVDGRVPCEKLFYVPPHLMGSLQAEGGKPDACVLLLLEKRNEMAIVCPSFTVLLSWMDRCTSVRCQELRDTELLRNYRMGSVAASLR
jgi:hypothetical protein